jgi:cytidine deaminase
MGADRALHEESTAETIKGSDLEIEQQEHREARLASGIAHPFTRESSMSRELHVSRHRVGELQMQDRLLVQQALAARARAYAPYSRFQVGAALATADGKIFLGCNIENASYGLTNCAERTALFTAVAAGERIFSHLAIASPGGVMPCGACRQVLAEFAPELTILLIDVDHPVQASETNLGYLLPGRFELQPH